MKQTINFNQFHDEFNSIRPDNFSYDGLRALFDYIEEYEESCDQEVELDVIALCCEYTEYEDIQEYINAYDPDVKREDYEDEEEFKEALEEHIEYNTQLIKLGDDLDEGFIIFSY